MGYTLGSLFSGIGGIDLAFSREGFDIRWQVEIDPFCRQVLAKHSDRWPNSEVHEDVHGVGKHNLTAVDVMAGGFPCQPISHAGRRKAQKDPRWLWPDFARIIGELRPRFVFLENVPGITTAGGSDVVTDLATLGYDAEWGIVPAVAAGAAHKRERWWLVAYPAGNGRQSWRPERQGQFREDASIINGALADATSKGLQGTMQSGAFNPFGTQDQPHPQSILGRAVNGLSGRLDGVTPIAGPGKPQYAWERPRTTPKGLPDRARRLEALGNAVYVPLVQIFAAAIRQELEAGNRLPD